MLRDLYGAGWVGLMWTPARSVTPPVEAIAATLNDVASGEGI